MDPELGSRPGTSDHPQTVSEQTPQTELSQYWYHLKERKRSSNKSWQRAGADPGGCPDGQGPPF